MTRVIVAATAALIVLASPAEAAETTGAGSTFVTPIIAKWAAEFAAKTGHKVNYQSIGSGGGITQIKSATVDFAMSDMPMKPEELKKLGLGQFPLVIGGVVPVVNIDGVRPGEMRLSGPLLADIFAGKIMTWSDPAIQALNPSLKLPVAPIMIVHRADGSGTTFNWTSYLSKVSPQWKANVGEGAAVDWPLGLGGRGNEGVVALVTQTRFSIGYVEYAYAVQNKLAYALVQSRSGRFVKPSAESFHAAAANAEWAKARDFYLVMTDAPGDDAYPITASVFVLMHKDAKNPARAATALEFFKWALEHGQAQAISLDYVPLPGNLVDEIEAYWKAQFAGWKG